MFFAFIACTTWESSSILSIVIVTPTLLVIFLINKDLYLPRERQVSWSIDRFIFQNSYFIYRIRIVSWNNRRVIYKYTKTENSKYRK